MLNHFMKDLEIAKRHTAEHIFMRTLTNMLERVRVVKVEHGEDVNKVFLEAGSITWEDVVNAAKTTNKVIQEDRIVRMVTTYLHVRCRMYRRQESV